VHFLLQQHDEPFVFFFFVANHGHISPGCEGCKKQHGIVSITAAAASAVVVIVVVVVVPSLRALPKSSNLQAETTNCIWVRARFKLKTSKSKRRRSRFRCLWLVDRLEHAAKILWLVAAISTSSFCKPAPPQPPPPSPPVSSPSSTSTSISLRHTSGESLCTTKSKVSRSREVGRRALADNSAPGGEREAKESRETKEEEEKEDGEDGEDGEG
jgi:hypothetical protein